MASRWSTSWGTSWGASWDRAAVAPSPRPWLCTWARSWGDSWGDTSTCTTTPPEPPVTPTDPSGGWGEVLRQRRVPRRVREVLEEVALEQADRQEWAQKAVGEAQAEQEYLAVAEGALDALMAALRLREIAWKAQYAELLRMVIAGILAQRAAEREAALQAVEAARVARNNENARRVLLLMMLQ